MPSNIRCIDCVHCGLAEADREHILHTSGDESIFYGVCSRFPQRSLRPLTYWSCGQYVKRLETKPKKIIHYKSQDGFELLPLRRGFTEIRPLWAIMEEVKSKVNKDCFICGGYARWCASPKAEPVPCGDIDIYCETEAVFTVMDVVLKQKAKLKVKSENSMAISYERPKSGEFHYMPPIQLIKPIKDGAIVAKGNKETILSNFDFTVIRAAIETPTYVFVDKDFKHDETHGILRLKNIHHPLSSLLRCCKYTKRGYWLHYVEAFKLFNAWDTCSTGDREFISDMVGKLSGGVNLAEEDMTAFYEIVRGRNG